MNKICTTIEQSEKLIELSLDVKTADMCWSIDIPDLPTLLAYPITDCDNWENKTPAWSLSALLNILAEQDFRIKSLERNNEYHYNIDIPIRHCQIWFPSLLDAAFEMICWLNKNNKL